MMKWIFGGMIVLSILFALATGNVAEVSNAALSECQNAVQFLLILLGSMCLWGGFLKIAERSGLTQIIAKILSPLTRILFPSLKKDSKALTAISMNITANFLALGNAATPLGIAAMKALKEEAPGPQENTASHSMILFILLNTASIQLLPTTVATLRLQNGSSVPMDILPAVLVTSCLSLLVALLSALLCRQAAGLRRHTEAQGGSSFC